MRKEITRRAGVLSDKALKKAPMTLDKKASEKKIMIVVADESNKRLNETELSKERLGGGTKSAVNP